MSIYNSPNLGTIIEASEYILNVSRSQKNSEKAIPLSFFLSIHPEAQHDKKYFQTALSIVKDIHNGVYEGKINLAAQDAQQDIRDMLKEYTALVRLDRKITNEPLNGKTLAKAIESTLESLITKYETQLSKPDQAHLNDFRADVQDLYSMLSGTAYLIPHKLNHILNNTYFQEHFARKKEGVTLQQYASLVTDWYQQIKSEVAPLDKNAQ